MRPWGGRSGLAGAGVGAGQAGVRVHFEPRPGSGAGPVRPRPDSGPGEARTRVRPQPRFRPQPGGDPLSLCPEEPVLLAGLKPGRPQQYDWKSSCETWSVAFSSDGAWFAWSQGHCLVKLIPWPLQETEL